MRRSGRPIAVGTVFVWQTREYEVDDITAAINGRSRLPLNLANRNGPAILSWSSAFPAASRSIPRPVSLHDCTQTGAPQFTGTVRHFHENSQSIILAPGFVLLICPALQILDRALVDSGQP